MFFPFSAISGDRTGAGGQSPTRAPLSRTWCRSVTLRPSCGQFVSGEPQVIRDRCPRIPFRPPIARVIYPPTFSATLPDAGIAALVRAERVSEHGIRMPVRALTHLPIAANPTPRRRKGNLFGCPLHHATRYLHPVPIFSFAIQSAPPALKMAGHRSARC